MPEREGCARWHACWVDVEVASALHEAEMRHDGKVDLVCAADGSLYEREVAGGGC